VLTYAEFAPVMLVTLGAAATAADLDYAPKLLGIPWLFAGAASLFMPFIHALGGPSDVQIGDDEFDRMFVLSRSASGSASLLQMRYVSA